MKTHNLHPVCAFFLLSEHQLLSINIFPPKVQKYQNAVSFIRICSVYIHHSRGPHNHPPLPSPPLYHRWASVWMRCTSVISEMRWLVYTRTGPSQRPSHCGWQAWHVMSASPYVPNGQLSTHWPLTVNDLHDRHALAPYRRNIDSARMRTRTAVNTTRTWVSRSEVSDKHLTSKQCWWNFYSLSFT